MTSGKLFKKDLLVITDTDIEASEAGWRGMTGVSAYVRVCNEA